MRDESIAEDDRTARQTGWSPYDAGSSEDLRGLTSRLFESVEGPTPYPVLPELKKELEQFFEEPRPALELPSESIWRIAACPTAKDPEGEAAQLARNQVDAEPVRAKLRAAATAILKAIHELQKTVGEVRERLAQDLLHTCQFEKVACAADRKPPLLARIAAALGLLLYGTLFLLCLLAESKNAIWLVQTALPEHFEYDKVGAACLSLIYVVGPFVVYKLLFHRLSNTKKARLLGLIKFVGVPLCLAGLAIFAWKMGIMMDPLSIAKQPPWEPPFWAIVATSMLLLAGSVMSLPILAAESLDRLSSYELTETREWSVISDRVHRLNRFCAEIEARKARLEAVGPMLDAERADFVNRTLAELRFVREQLDARSRTAVLGPHSSRLSQSPDTSTVVAGDK